MKQSPHFDYTHPRFHAQFGLIRSWLRVDPPQRFPKSLFSIPEILAKGMYVYNFAQSLEIRAVFGFVFIHNYFVNIFWGVLRRSKSKAFTFLIVNWVCQLDIPILRNLIHQKSRLRIAFSLFEFIKKLRTNLIARTAPSLSRLNKLQQARNVKIAKRNIWFQRFE